MIELHDNGIRFDQGQHRYFLGGKELSGITSTLMRRAFPGQYKGVPERVLANAASRGSVVHGQIELLNTIYGGDIGEFPVSALSPELSSYACMVQDNGLRYVASEYIVTDGIRYASPIDGVFLDADGNVVLVDYKTTYKLLYENVSLQLSIYARLFELCNPGLKVGRIACMWMRDNDSRFAVLPRVSDEALNDLFRAEEENDASYVYRPEVPGGFFCLEAEYAGLARQIADLQSKQDDVKARILEFMEQNHAKTYRSAFGTFSYVGGSSSLRFDASAFKKAEPGLYAQYTKEFETKPQVRIKLKD